MNEDHIQNRITWLESLMGANSKRISDIYTQRDTEIRALYPTKLSSEEVLAANNAIRKTYASKLQEFAHVNPHLHALVLEQRTLARIHNTRHHAPQHYVSDVSGHMVETMKQHVEAFWCSPGPEGIRRYNMAMQRMGTLAAKAGNTALTTNWAGIAAQAQAKYKQECEERQREIDEINLHAKEAEPTR